MSNKEERAGKHDGTRARVPRLRFPEFREAGEWETKPFEELFIIGNGKDYKHLSNGEVPVYGSGGYMLSVNDHLHDGESVCIGRKGTINSPMFLTGKFWAVDTLFYTHSFTDCLPRFIYSIFQNVDWLKYNEAGGVPSLSKTNIGKIKVAVPKLKEQQKIADCLSSLDDLITLESQKLNALKTHKKGLMQQLFPAEGETVPRLRFPEFREAGDWDYKSGGLVFDQISNKDHNCDLPLLAITQEQGAIPRDLIDYHVSVTEKSIESYKVVEIGDFIISLRSFQGGIEYSGYNGICSPAYVILRLKTGYSSGYFKQFLKTIRFIAQLTKNIEGLRDGKMISYHQFSEQQLPTPSLSEQQKISDCLSSLDDLITAQAQKVEVLKTHKKGLMQQLFPTLEDTPG